MICIFDDFQNVYSKEIIPLNKTQALTPIKGINSNELFKASILLLNLYIKQIIIKNMPNIINILYFHKLVKTTLCQKTY